MKIRNRGGAPCISMCLLERVHADAQKREQDRYDHDDDDDDGGGDDDDDHEGDDHEDDDYHYGDLPASAVTVRCERSETVKSAPSAASTRSY